MTTSTRTVDPFDRPIDLGDPVPIHVAIARIIGDLPAIEKADAGQFSALKVDDIVAELKRLQHRHGVVVLPSVLERIPEDRPTRGGTVMHTVHLLVSFTFVGPDGSWLTASAWGEGSDAGDKSTAKAMTGAYKSALRQVFAIADAAGTDPDFAHHSEETVAWWVEAGWSHADEESAVHAQIIDRLRALNPTLQKMFKSWRLHHRIELDRALDHSEANDCLLTLGALEKGEALQGHESVSNPDPAQGSPGPVDSSDGPDASGLPGT